MTDNVNRPQHYENGPFECILLTEQYSFNVGNMIKYVWRHKAKGHPKEDLQKALVRETRRRGQRGFYPHANGGSALPPLPRLSIGPAPTRRRS